MAKRRKSKYKVRNMIFAVIGFLIVIEIIALVWLYFSVGRYKNFWEQKAKEDGEITYLALGDSAAQGIGASSPMKGYVGLVANRLEEKTGKTVKIVNVSKTGATIDDYLKDQAKYVDEVKPDVVTIEIGANDIRTFNGEEFRKGFKKVLDTLPDGAYVSNMPLFNSRPFSTPKAKEASEIIAQEIQNYRKLVLADLQKYTAENQSIFGFAPDLFHPNNLSYKNWANAFWHQIDKNPRY